MGEHVVFAGRRRDDVSSLYSRTNCKRNFCCDLMGGTPISSHNLPTDNSAVESPTSLTERARSIPWCERPHNG